MSTSMSTPMSTPVSTPISSLSLLTCLLCKEKNTIKKSIFCSVCKSIKCVTCVIEETTNHCLECKVKYSIFSCKKLIPKERIEYFELKLVKDFNKEIQNYLNEENIKFFALIKDHIYVFLADLFFFLQKKKETELKFEEFEKIFLMDKFIEKIQSLNEIRNIGLNSIKEKMNENKRDLNFIEEMNFIEYLYNEITSNFMLKIEKEIQSCILICVTNTTKFMYKYSYDIEILKLINDTNFQLIQKFLKNKDEIFNDFKSALNKKIMSTYITYRAETNEKYFQILENDIDG